jgi:hypothetical protein
MHTDKRGPQMYELVTTNKKDTEKWRGLLTETVWVLRNGCFLLLLADRLSQADSFRKNFPDYEEQVQEAVAEAAARDKEDEQADTLEEGLSQVLGRSC